MFGFVCSLIVDSFGIIYGLLFLALLPQIAFTEQILLPHPNTVEEEISLNMDEFRIKLVFLRMFLLGATCIRKFGRKFLDYSTNKTGSDVSNSQRTNT